MQQFDNNFVNDQRISSLTQELAASGLTVVESGATINANHQLLATVATANGEILGVTADIDIPEDEPFQLKFEFKNGPYQGKKFTIKSVGTGRDPSLQIFQDENGLPISAAAAFEKIKKQKEQIQSAVLPPLQPTGVPHEPFIPVSSIRPSRSEANTEPSRRSGTSIPIKKLKPVAATFEPQASSFYQTSSAEKVAFSTSPKIEKILPAKISTIPTTTSVETVPQRKASLEASKQVSTAKITTPPPKKEVEKPKISPTSQTQPVQQPMSPRTLEAAATPPAKKKSPWGKIAAAAAIGAGPIIGAGAYASTITNVIFFS